MCENRYMLFEWKVLKLGKVKSLEVKTMHVHVLTLLGGDLCMTLTLSCPSKKSSYFSQITIYIEHMISKWYSSSTRFSLHIFIFGWWCHDIISTPNLCELVQSSVKGLRETRLTEVVGCNFIYFGIFSLYWDQLCERVHRSVKALRETRLTEVVGRHFGIFSLYWNQLRERVQRI